MSQAGLTRGRVFTSDSTSLRRRSDRKRLARLRLGGKRRFQMSGEFDFLADDLVIRELAFLIAQMIVSVVSLRPKIVENPCGERCVRGANSFQFLSDLAIVPCCCL